MKETRVSRWYFGGISSSAAACLTHPLDLIKVHLQTQQEVRVRMIGMTVNVVRSEGFLALYSGLSASVCRQMTYSLTRFAIYETVRDKLSRENKGLMPFYQKVLLGAFGGFAGGFIGTPADLVNVRGERACAVGMLAVCVVKNLGLNADVCRGFRMDPRGHGFMMIFTSRIPERTHADAESLTSPTKKNFYPVKFEEQFQLNSIARMQNDVKLPVELRRNYAHALDGLLRVWKEEGMRKLFRGATMASARGALVTVGQLSCYDQSKQLFLNTGYLTDNILTHFLASVFAGGCATILCQPLDVVKTRLMNSKLEYGGVFHCLTETAKLGPKAFYKGLVPAGIRLIPQTVFTFIFLEQLRRHFGVLVVT